MLSWVSETVSLTLSTYCATFSLFSALGKELKGGEEGEGIGDWGRMYQTRRIRQKPDSLPSRSLANAQTARASHLHLAAWPSSSGSTTLSPICRATPAYMLPSSAGPAGLHASNTSLPPPGTTPAPRAGKRAKMMSGERKAPATLPTTTETTAAASSPPAARVMTTLEAMVVGMHAATSMPIMTGTPGTRVRRAPAAMLMRMMAVLAFSFYVSFCFS